MERNDLENFDELVANLDSGQFNTNLTQKMREALRAMRESVDRHGKASAEVSLTVQFKAETNGRVEIKTKTKIKAPGIPEASETRWINKAGALQASDPRQDELPAMRVVPPAGSAARAPHGDAE